MHIAGKSNPADHLSRHSIKELKSMVDVRNMEESMVQRLRLGEGSQLTRIFRGNWIRCLQMVSRRDLVSRSIVKQILYILSILYILQFVQLVQPSDWIQH